MNMISHKVKSLALCITTALVLSACASPPSAPDGVGLVRGKLTELQGDSRLATLAPVEIRDAEDAVRLAETPERDEALGRHRLLLADRKVDIARSWAQSRLYEEQRDDLNRQSEQARLDSRTREAEQARRETAVARNATDVARNQAANARGDAAGARGDAAVARNETEVAQDQAAVARNQTSIARGDAASARNQTGIARADAANARGEADSARGEADIARRDNAATQQENDELQQQILDLNGRATDRGLVVTLGDVLFATGQSTIQGGNTSNLDKLAVFLNRYEDRSVAIEGHTDDVGNNDTNLTLSQNRANAVRSYLVGEGVAMDRFVASGMGEAAPVASNATDTGRQQNRRVEVIIADAR
jgi:outer membrane protein OmpA-like peptidoglycan-associated protein